LNVAGRDQLLLTGCDLVSSFDPKTGAKLWEVKGATTECVTSTVTDGKHIYSSGGFPKSHVAAISADGSGKVVWEKNARVYVPSMLIRDGYLYAVLDAGVATCWKSDNGEVAWSHRLGGNFTASPILVGDRIFVTSETGQTHIFKADPKAFQLVGENPLTGEVLATPTICRNQVYLRLAKQNKEKREEYLYCLGERK
jgi:outer membrane protein assembly factor BamB